LKVELEKVDKPSILITGSEGAIGTALRTKFSTSGWNVISVDLERSDRDNHFRFDLSKLSTAPKSVEVVKFIADLRSSFKGNLKGIVHNAAYQVVSELENLEFEAWKKSFDVNIHAPFVLSTAFQADLAATGGTIIAISSIHEKLTKPGFAAYSVSKSALSALVRAMAVELGRANIRVNGIRPAAIDTAMLRRGFGYDDEKILNLKSFHPTNSLGTSDEIAELAYLLSNEKLQFLNGAMVDCDGGIGSKLHDPS
jgi:NAD(P)-dependent dehydrogenase (short-subunit alcohol dehydrogenase family)